MRFTKEMIGFPVIWSYNQTLGTVEEVTDTSVIVKFPVKGTLAFGLSGSSEPGRSARHARVGHITLFSGNSNGPATLLFKKAEDILWMFKCTSPIKSILLTEEDMIIRTETQEWKLPVDVFSLSLYYIRQYFERLNEEKITFLNH